MLIYINQNYNLVLILVFYHYNKVQNYIEYLEGKEDVLNTLVDYFNQLDESKGFESKKEILDKVLTLLPSE